MVVWGRACTAFVNIGEKESKFVFAKDLGRPLWGSHGSNSLVPGAGLEPARARHPPDFKSGASACSATPAFVVNYATLQPTC